MLTRLEVFRVSRGISVTDLINESGISPQHLFRIRRGMVQPGRDMIAAVTSALRRISLENVRPEDVILQSSAGATNGEITARVAVRTFLGNINEYFVTLASGETLRAQTPPKLNFAVGDTVALSFDSANLSVFPHTAGNS